MNIALLLGLVLVASASVGASVPAKCEGSTDMQDCTPNYSSFFDNGNRTKEITENLRTFTSEMVDKSFKFLFMSSVFNKHDMDRPGFEKLYRKFSDKAWEDAIELVKYQNRRGSHGYLVTASATNKPFTQILETSELKSLQTALDIDKYMADEAHKIHKQVSHDHHTRTGTDQINYDPDMAHYLDEKIISYQSGVIRDLAGYVQTLSKITKQGVGKNQAEDLALHLFDEYLEKSL